MRSCTIRAAADSARRCAVCRSGERSDRTLRVKPPAGGVDLGAEAVELVDVPAFIKILVEVCEEADVGFEFGELLGIVADFRAKGVEVFDVGDRHGYFL
jgi:hypothetical protein